MKKYLLEIYPEDASYREKTEEGLSVKEIRLIVSVLEEVKLRMVNEIIICQQEFNLRKTGKAS